MTRRKMPPTKMLPHFILMSARMSIARMFGRKHVKNFIKLGDEMVDGTAHSTNAAMYGDEVARALEILSRPTTGSGRRAVLGRTQSHSDMTREEAKRIVEQYKIEHKTSRV
jgi:hypothetical protein